MRMLPSFKSRSRSFSGNKSNAASNDHRRSWHMGFAGSHHGVGVGGSSRDGGRRSKGGGGGKKRHRATWHFPRLSRHSMHNHHQSHHSRNEDHHSPPPLETTATVTTGCYDVELAQERKTFSYAPSFSASTGESLVTRPPSPPPGSNINTDSQRQEEGYHQDHLDPKHNDNDTKRRDGFLRKSKKKTFRFFRAIEDFFFPGCAPLHSGSSSSGGHSKQQQQQQQRVRGGVLMRSCQTAAEHKAKVRETVEIAKTMYGEEGLRAVGFEYRFLPCPNQSSRKDYKPVSSMKDTCHIPRGEDEEEKEEEGNSTNDENIQNTNQGSGEGIDHEDACIQNETEIEQADDTNSATMPPSRQQQQQQENKWPECARWLFHIESNTIIESKNRKLFIADGDMYDSIADLCMDNSHEVMQREFGMVWVTLCSADEEGEENTNPMKKKKHEPIRALVNREHIVAAAQHRDGKNDQGEVSKEEVEFYSKQPTLLIVTGKGKVRAGIFSRQHSLVSGMEQSTCIPLIHEARMRNLNLVIIDPNCHGDRCGMETFEKSMGKVFYQWEDGRSVINAGHENDTTLLLDDQHQNTQQICRDLYILSHSASGAQLVRYLLDKSKHYLPHIRAIAFTDSTHNVQWARQRGNNDLVDLLESDSCVYFRCATSETTRGANEQQAGEAALTDNFWKHRFGNVRTCWAGTTEHSLTNWFAHKFIWEHFDKSLVTSD